MARLARLPGRLTDRLLASQSPLCFREHGGHYYGAHWILGRKYASNIGPQGSPSLGPGVQELENDQEKRSQNHNGSTYSSTAYKMFESAASTFASLTVLA